MRSTGPLAIEARHLAKTYGRRKALVDCTLQIPAGRIVGLVGPNGAGKSTLLQLTCGLIRPSAGHLQVLGAAPGDTPEHLAKVGFVAQDTPVYRSLTVAEHLELGRRVNPRWDRQLAEARVEDVGLVGQQKAGALSGGQRAQLALTLAAATRPELLILDEPAAALDPLARRSFMQSLSTFVREIDATAVLSSHLLEDVERTCDFIAVLVSGRLQVAGPVAELTTTHRVLAAGSADRRRLPPGATVVAVDGDAALVCLPAARGDEEPVGVPAPLTDLVLAYLASPPTANGHADGPGYEGGGGR
jgi:ABC-2 type transport system ATP-binding protein